MPKGKKRAVKPKVVVESQKEPEEEPEVPQEDESDVEDSPVFDKASKMAKSKGKSTGKAWRAKSKEPGEHSSEESAAESLAPSQGSSAGKGKGKGKGKSKLKSVKLVEKDDDDVEGQGSSAEDSDTSQPPSKKQRKKSLSKVTLLHEQEEVLVGWIQENPCLYDRSLVEYRYTQKKTSMWEAQAKKMDLPVEVIMQWYDSQRTRYGRLCKTKSGQAAPKLTHREQWLQKAFGFLETHIYRQPSRTT